MKFNYFLFNKINFFFKLINEKKVINIKKDIKKKDNFQTSRSSSQYSNTIITEGLSAVESKTISFTFTTFSCDNSLNNCF